ncbi:MAG TPA: GntR family transcriptional regulator [Microbacteriaceae bacterium]
MSFILPLNSASPVADRPQSLTEQIHERMHEEILMGTWRPGDLVLEPELANRYGVSKTPVREALRLLSQEGWIITMPRKGYLVRPLRLHDIREVFELRLLIEPGLFVHAARRGDAGQFASMRALVESEAEQGETDDSAGSPGREFHLTMARMADNSRATGILIGLLDEVRRLHQIMPGVPTHPPAPDLISEHGRILAAMEDRDADEVHRLVRDHIQASADLVMDAYRLAMG